MIVLGLTGSIGMGKSTVAAMFRTLGVPVHCADEEVHRLLEPRGEGARLLAKIFPRLSFPGLYGRKIAGRYPFNRRALGDFIFGQDHHRRALERTLHPLVRKAQNTFIRTHKRAGQFLVVLDIPLLFETGGEQAVDYTLVVTAPARIQQARVLARRGMTREKFEAISDRQLPDAEKRARADHVIRTGLGRADTMRQVKVLVHTLQTQNKKGAAR